MSVLIQKGVRLLAPRKRQDPFHTASLRFQKIRDDLTELRLLFSIWRNRRHISHASPKHSSSTMHIGVAICFGIVSCILLVFSAVHATPHTADPKGNTDDIPTYTLSEQPQNTSVTVSLADGAAPPVILTVAPLPVGEVLQTNGITLGTYDTLSADLSDIVTDGMSIEITRISVTEETYTEEIPYQTKTNQVQTIPKGTSQVLQKGQNGFRRVTERITTCNGVAKQREILADTVEAEPINEVIAYGTGGVLLGKDGVSYAFSYYIDVSATAYGPTGYNTATGVPPTEGTIAVDPNVIPLRSKVYVKGNYGDYGVCRAEDTGGGIKGNRIDVYLGYVGENWYEEAMQFGIRSMRVYILN